MSADKRNRFRFTLQFNQNDPNHERAVNILNRQGKSISQFIASAVLHYVDCNKQPIDSSKYTEEMIKLVVKQTLEEVGKRSSEGASPLPMHSPSSRQQSQAGKPSEPSCSTSDEQNFLANAMEMFKGN